MRDPRRDEGEARRLEFYQVTVAHARTRPVEHAHLWGLSPAQPIHVDRKSKLRGGTRNRKKSVCYLLENCGKIYKARLKCGPQVW